MYCPECNGEFREGFFTCADCGVALVEQPPPSAQPVPESDLKLVTMLETGDPNELAFVEAVLTDSGIPVFKTGDSLQELFALGRLGFGFNPISGPVILQVEERHAEAAARILEEVEPAELEDDPEEAEETE